MGVRSWDLNFEIKFKSQDLTAERRNWYYTNLFRYLQEMQ